MKWLLAILPLNLAVAAENPLAVELISEAKSIEAGKTFTLGLHLTHPEGYHTYWKHPGAVGVATSVKWELPPGFVAGEIQWPAPEAVKMARYTAQGYHDETLLMIPVTPPANLKEAPVTLTAKVSWMCCGKQCNPASDVPFAITLPVTATTERDSATRPVFEKYRHQVPQPDPAWSAAFDRRGKTFVLTLKPADPAVTRDVGELGELRFFTADGQIDSDTPQTVTRGPGQVIRIELPVSENEQTGDSPAGVVVATGGWRKSGGPQGLELR
ncbi:protein-disulfide reductase DsbD domain-containing protein [Luteolibacter marinus]|uniref:protein-disulfide reductase DsbD domain-containing protein n=1 Tax=Luteolibacter marinus TaxID=2776705 RepID=UPI0018671F3F|nr:protein-disulfide reductase DsbD domain-containing protein [Luteolibacter marinus]